MPYNGLGASIFIAVQILVNHRCDDVFLPPSCVAVSGCDRNGFCCLIAGVLLAINGKLERIESEKGGRNAFTADCISCFALVHPVI